MIKTKKAILSDVMPPSYKPLLKEIKKRIARQIELSHSLWDNSIKSASIDRVITFSIILQAVTHRPTEVAILFCLPPSTHTFWYDQKLKEIDFSKLLGDVRVDKSSYEKKLRASTSFIQSKVQAEIEKKRLEWSNQS